DDRGDPHTFPTRRSSDLSEPEKWRPETRETADHSLPYITAIALIDGKVTGEQFQPARFTDPAIWKFLENVKVTRSAELSSLYPGDRKSTRLNSSHRTISY